MRERGLCGGGSGFSLRCEATGVRGRERYAHLDGSPEIAGSERRAGLRQGAQKPRKEHDADRLDEPLWDGRDHVERPCASRAPLTRKPSRFTSSIFWLGRFLRGRWVVLDELLKRTGHKG